MKLVIAEKPMLARDIARAICGTPVPESAPLPISGNGYTVIACSGHLLELVEPEAVNPAWADRYDLDLLPISIPDWPKEPAVVRDKETGEVIDSKEPLIDKIAVLLPQADCVIHAGDPDDEGQLIVDEVLDYLGYEGEVLRVYVNDNIAKPPKGGVYDKTGNMLSGYGWVAALLVVAAVAGAGYAGKQYLDARKEKDGDADGGES